MRSVRSLKGGLIACLLGFGLAAVVQVASPLPGPPLYDGVVTIDPYVYLEPSGNQQGGARWATTNETVGGGVSPVVAIGTPEHPPQAQLIAGAGALALPSGTTTLVVTITPVPPAAQPASGSILGNVYRVSVANQAGAPVSPIAGKQVTLALRDPGSSSLVTIDLLVGGQWRALPTVSAGVSGTYETTDLNAFGDFALVGSGDSGTGASTQSPWAVVSAAAILLVLVLGAAAFLRRRVVRGRGQG